MKMEVMVVIGKGVVLGSGNDGDIITVMEPEAQDLRQAHGSCRGSEFDSQHPWLVAYNHL